MANPFPLLQIFICKRKSSSLIFGSVPDLKRVLFLSNFWLLLTSNSSVSWFKEAPCYHKSYQFIVCNRKCLTEQSHHAMLVEGTFKPLGSSQNLEYMSVLKQITWLWLQLLYVGLKLSTMFRNLKFVKCIYLFTSEPWIGFLSLKLWEIVTVFLNNSISASVGELCRYRHDDLQKVEECLVITELF